MPRDTSFVNKSTGTSSKKCEEYITSARRKHETYRDMISVGKGRMKYNYSGKKAQSKPKVNKAEGMVGNIQESRITSSRKKKHFEEHSKPKKSKAPGIVRSIDEKKNNSSRKRYHFEEHSKPKINTAVGREFFRYVPD